MDFFHPTRFKVVSSFIIFAVFLGVAVTFSLTTLSHSSAVLGATIQPDFASSQTAGSAANLQATNDTPNTSRVLLLAFSPFRTTYFPELVTYVRFIALLMLYALSFVFACAITNIVNNPLRTHHSPVHRKHHRRK